ncbi:MAG: hypothetical protein ABR992_04880 [Solirubrobacteraceae bacterium]
MTTPAALVVSLGFVLSGGVWQTTSSLAAATSQRPAKQAHHKKTPPPPQVTLTPTTGSGGVPVTLPPVGLSLEYPIMAQDLGAGACPPPALVSELQQLGSPPLALAGDSQDETAPSGVLANPSQSWEAATLYTLPATFWSQLHCLLNTAKDPLTVGLNARTGQISWAAQMVAGAQSAATNGLDFSLGNEPDLYYLPNYAELDKPQANEETAAVNTYLQIAEQLKPALGEAPVIGPELARPAHWQHELPRVISQLHEQIVGVHLYPLTSCATPKAVTIPGLLSSEAAETPRSLAWVVADAGAANAQAIISEANSASCGGVAGVSDSPAAAVWAVRFVLSALKTGFKEVRFHFSGGPYDPFVVDGETVLNRPLESALAALQQWLPIGSSLRSLTVRGLVATAVAQPAGTGLLILDNEHRTPQSVILRGVSSTNIETLGPTRTGLLSAELTSPSDRIKLTVAPNSVLAVSPSG